MKISYCKFTAFSFSLMFALLLKPYLVAGNEAPFQRNSLIDTINSDIQLIVSIEDRKLHVYKRSIHIASYSVTVGKDEYPTPRGDLFITQIDMNPEWVPPASEWAAGRTYKRPGHPENPLSLVRMHLNDEYRVHGTLDHWSVGRKASRGCIRLKNTEIMKLTRVILRYSEVENHRSVFQQAEATPYRMIQVDLPQPVLLSVYDNMRYVPKRLFNSEKADTFTNRKHIAGRTISSTLR